MTLCNMILCYERVKYKVSELKDIISVYCSQHSDMILKESTKIRSNKIDRGLKCNLRKVSQKVLPALALTWPFTGLINIIYHKITSHHKGG